MPCNGRAIRHLPTPRREIRPCTGRLHRPRTRAPHGLPPCSCGRQRNDRPFFRHHSFRSEGTQSSGISSILANHSANRRDRPLSRRSGRIRPSACARSIRRPQRRTSGPPVRRAAVPHVRSARHHLRYCPIRCRTTSKSITAAAAETLSDSICPISGMASCSSQSLSTSFEIPRSSAPITSTVGRRKSAS